MIKGVYSAASSLEALQQAQDLLAADVANVGTNGFRASRAAEGEFLRQLVYQVGGFGGLTANTPTVGTGAVQDVTSIDLSQGPLRQTGRSLDLALDGDGFFALQAADGSVRYTRDGRFSLDALGHLVAGDGSLALGTNGPLTVQGGEIGVAADGTVTDAAGKTMDRLRIEALPAGSLQRVGSSEFRAGEPGAPATAKVVQGALEGSNVNLVRTMTAMMEVLRAYEASQRLLQMQDQTLSTAATQVGAV